MPYTPPYRRNPDKPKHDRFDKITLAVAIVGVTVIAISAGISAWQAIVFTRQQAVMQAQLSVMEAQNRPWLAIDHIEPESVFVGVDFRQDGAVGVSPNIVVKNVGQAVGTGAFVETRVFAVGNRIGDLYEIVMAENDLCDIVRAQTFRDPKYLGDAIFPGAETTLPDNSWTEINIVRKKAIQFQGKKYLRLLLVGCVDYQFYVSPQRHQTRFMYSIKLKGGIDDLIPIGSNISSSQITFAPFSAGNGYAD